MRLLLLAMLACSRGATDARTCAVDADCVVVQTACCDHCNGGKLEAFHRAHADAHRATGCESMPCRPVACAPITATASCKAGSCTLAITARQD